MERKEGDARCQRQLEILVCYYMPAIFRKWLHVHKKVIFIMIYYTGAQPPRSVTSFCSVIVWKAPTRVYGVITGYDVSFSPPGEDNGVIVSNDRDELFHVVRASELPPRQGDILVKVCTMDYTELTNFAAVPIIVFRQ